ncbi:MAG: adenosylmethionine--8-amino-7-oxononanoate transaminase [Myxococcales bacterium]|nr:adenosylmethionine--8-amino-7-oxononanoate transaminase [Myxococcales bacterium]
MTDTPRQRRPGETLADLDRRHLWHPFTQQQQWEESEPLVIAAAEGNELIDTDGRRYLDGVASLWVSVHGHRCREIDEAVRAQLDRVAHSTMLGLSNVPAIELARELARVTPEGLERVFYSDSGSTAVEVALKMAYQYWQLRGRPQKHKFIALEQAYHGDTIGAVSVGGIDLFHKIFHPLLFAALRVPAPAEPFAHAAAGQRASAERSLHALGALLEQRHDEIAALVIEPRVQGAAGMLVHPDGYLRAVEKLCRRYDVLLVVDEVATGFGRSGPLFSCDAEGVRPDLMAIAKGITGGYLPLAATLSSEAIYDAFRGAQERKFFHGHTYTGNPLACAAALASLQRIERTDLLATAAARAAQLGAALDARVAPLEHVGQVRRRGLMVGVELVADRERHAPYDAASLMGHHVCMAVRRHGVILRPLGDVVVLMPPLTISEAQIETLVDATAAAIAEVTA